MLQSPGTADYTCTSCSPLMRVSRALTHIALPRIIPFWLSQKKKQCSFTVHVQVAFHSLMTCLELGLELGYLLILVILESGGNKTAYIHVHVNTHSLKDGYCTYRIVQNGRGSIIHGSHFDKLYKN